MAGPATKNAKIASKNNPTSRGNKVSMFFQGKEVIPVKFIGTAINQGVYMAIASTDGNMLFDQDNAPYKWDLAQTQKN
ncbi:MAG: hypothetical protein ACI9CD_000150 [Candidatus Deianiraeaceae bacterium]|jgi:hypothetical protein